MNNHLVSSIIKEGVHLYYILFFIVSWSNKYNWEDPSLNSICTVYCHTSFCQDFNWFQYFIKEFVSYNPFKINIILLPSFTRILINLSIQHIGTHNQHCISIYVQNRVIYNWKPPNKTTPGNSWAVANISRKISASCNNRISFDGSEGRELGFVGKDNNTKRDSTRRQFRLINVFIRDYKQWMN